ncbi:nephrin-like isoform X2 [Penaeus vannamei]|uniref:nephrin-like isoform X2 n=1 Tax=Penaeus vannamei TaxID=6689 RepID=UPI00387F8979
MWRRRQALLITTSLLCIFFQQGWCLLQSFRVPPQDIEAVAGDDAVLRCEVDNQQGKAQWTKNGFALGFNRSIPGFSRFSMTGPEADGVHNLKIRNVTLEDDGAYQCQVTPKGDALPIRHAAMLTVLIPPSSIEIVGRRKNERITERAGNSITLECLVKDSKPVSQIQWFRDGADISLESTTTAESESETNSHLKSLRSSITVTLSHTDNGKRYGCRAVHPALARTGTSMETEVTLDVQYEPGFPEITGYTEGEIVRAGDKKTLTCRARGGNPLPEVFWYKNGQQVDKNYIKHQSYVVNEYEFEVDASDNMAKYECHVMNVMTSQPKKAEMHLRVNFAASKVTITGPSQAKVGDVITITCVAENSNPPSDVNLVINGQTPPGATSRTQKVPNGGWNTITNLTRYEVRPIDADLMVNCYALNQALGSTKIDTEVISVLRPPETPVILGYERGQELRKGDRQRLTCVSNGGNPLATLTWYKGSQKLPSETHHDAVTALADVDILLDESDNGAEYRCEATNEATAHPLANSTVLSVMFPPSAVKVRAHPRVINAGSPMTLFCESASSNPFANITWWRDGFEVDGEYTVETKPGQFGGTVTNYSVKVEVTADDDGAVYTCQADNGFGSTTHDAVTISVHYSPVWVKEPPKSLDVKEGENVMLNASARGNPNSLAYLWRRGEEVVMADNILNISGITRDQAGVYSLDVSNTEGNIFRNVSINVKYAPIITEVTGSSNVSEGDSVTLVCHVDAVPNPDIEWRREGYNFERTKTKKHATRNIAEMTITNVTKEDTGVFACHSKNEIGEATIVNATVIVKHKPIIDTSPQYQKAAAEAGGNVQMVCRARGAPYIDFTWYTSENTPIEKAIYSRFTNRYKVEDRKLIDGLVTYESVLHINNVTSKDYGFFQCQARNSIGSSHTVIHLDGTSRPDTPLDLKVLNFTHDSVDLEWTPGFDGGLPQKYRIRYNIDTTKRYQYMDVYPENSTVFTVTGLALGTTYAFSVLSYNDKGESGFTDTDVKATTLRIAPPQERPVEGSKVPTGRVSGIIVITITLVGIALLILNVALVACFIKRRRLQASSDKGSSKSTTIEMYAPSSYTGTVTGETLSSISEKSRESYEHEDSTDEYEAEASRANATSTYLIEQLEPPSQYATRPPPHILPPPPSHNDLNIEDGYDEMIRNQYNIDPTGGYGTLGRRNPAPDHYNINPADSHYPPPTHRYNTYQPPTQHILTAHSHAQNNGSLRRNPPSKLHFPKDYIRNGSMNLPGGTGGAGTVGSQYSNKPQSPTRTHAPMLSTFAPEPQQITAGIPLEHRGHLV